MYGHMQMTSYHSRFLPGFPDAAKHDGDIVRGLMRQAVLADMRLTRKCSIIRCSEVSDPGYVSEGMLGFGAEPAVLSSSCRVIEAQP